MTQEEFLKLTELMNEHRKIHFNAVAERVLPDEAKIQKIEIYADKIIYELFEEDLKDDDFLKRLRDIFKKRAEEHRAKKEAVSARVERVQIIFND